MRNRRRASAPKECRIDGRPLKCHIVSIEKPQQVRQWNTEALAPSRRVPRRMAEKGDQAHLPSVDAVLRHADVAPLIETHGRPATTAAIRAVLAAARAARETPSPAAIETAVAVRLAAAAAPGLKPVFNLTGTVLHTNLGRAPLPDAAIAAMAAVARGATNLEFDLDSGRRGERDSHVEALLCRLTGAAAATVVNNNAAAVFLVLNALALGREVPVSRGELIEIGGAFRLPDIMKAAGCILREVGTTNRTHARDFEGAIGPDTALLMKVHTSNYTIEGFTAAVSERVLADIAHRFDLPMAVDLGSGTLVDLSRWGLAPEPTVAETLAAGADLVTFSGDKLLGGPQAGIIVGRTDLVERLRKSPVKRALRLGKTTLAALAAVLRLYADPDRLGERLPALRLLARPVDDIKALAGRLAPALEAALGNGATVEVVDCQSQIGSGALPVERLASVALAIRTTGGRRGEGAALQRIAAAFRALPMPVIGRIHDDALLFDLRCLEDEPGFLDQLAALAVNRS
jgi:L-seryl-tRNA(Ser) seleniumtransferase